MVAITSLVHPDVNQPWRFQEIGGKAKPYQVPRFIKVIEEHDLSFEDWP